MPETTPLSGLRVLIVEDEFFAAVELEDLLQGMGCIVVETAPTIAQALRALANEWPDVAVLDVNLRGEQVTPVAEILQERGVPFVLVTGYQRGQLHEEALQRAPLLRKPVEGRRLASELAGLSRGDAPAPPHPRPSV
jgi:CheY-like chemotaxis protein